MPLLLVIRLGPFLCLFCQWAQWAQWTRWTRWARWAEAFVPPPPPPRVNRHFSVSRHFPLRQRLQCLQCHPPSWPCLQCHQCRHRHCDGTRPSPFLPFLPLLPAVSLASSNANSDVDTVWNVDLTPSDQIGVFHVPQLEGRGIASILSIPSIPSIPSINDITSITDITGNTDITEITGTLPNHIGSMGEDSSDYSDYSDSSVQFYVGTKRGDLMHISLRKNRADCAGSADSSGYADSSENPIGLDASESCFVQEIRDFSDVDGAPAETRHPMSPVNPLNPRKPMKPYPIFSMVAIPPNPSTPTTTPQTPPTTPPTTDATPHTTPIAPTTRYSSSGNNRLQILTGSGDRFVTVWEPREDHTSNTTTNDSEWEDRNDSQCGQWIERSQGGQWSEGSKWSEWSVKTQLGPHTGWVKDLAVFPLATSANLATSNGSNGSTLVFSIGCNFIQVWIYIPNSHNNSDSVDNSDNADKTHNTDNSDNLESSEYREYLPHGKLEIGSSVEMGCTLSSDLLCLATHRTHTTHRTHVDHAKGYLFAGGVDGRIHQWAISNTSNSSNISNTSNMHDNESLLYNPSLQSLPSLRYSGAIEAHDGRVNRLLVCENLNVLVSVGSDGRVKWYDMSDMSKMSDMSSGPLDSWTSGSLGLHPTQPIPPKQPKQQKSQSKQSKQLIHPNVEGTSKLTSLCLVRDTPERAVIACGTADGSVSLVELTRCSASTNRFDANDCNDGNNDNSNDDCNKDSNGIPNVPNIRAKLMDGIGFQLERNADNSNRVIHALSCLTTLPASLTLPASQASAASPTSSTSLSSKEDIIATIAIGHSNGLSLWTVNVG